METTTCKCGRVIQYTTIIDDTYYFHGTSVGVIAWDGNDSVDMCQECADAIVLKMQ